MLCVVCPIVSRESRLPFVVFFLLVCYCGIFFFFFSSRRRHTRFDCDWSSDVCSSDLLRLSQLVLIGVHLCLSVVSTAFSSLNEVDNQNRCHRICPVGRRRRATSG